MRAIAKYSTGTDKQFIAKLTMIAVLVEAPLISAMDNGPSSLHSRSIRLICALTVDSVPESAPDITTTLRSLGQYIAKSSQ
jgi:hypothetical protein